MPEILIPIILALLVLSATINSANGQENSDSGQSDIFPKGRHGIGDPCNYETWKRFQKDRNALFEVIKTLDPSLTNEELNSRIAAEQANIISKKYEGICWFHPYLECTPENTCICANHGPPFNFELKGNECVGRRGSLCDLDDSYFGCTPNLKCELALAGTPICDGKLGYDEELKKFQSQEKDKTNGSSLREAISCVVMIPIYIVVLEMW